MSADEETEKCEICNGELIVESEEKIFYTGPDDDPEPDYFIVWAVTKCKECGIEVDREEIARESL